MRRVLWLACAAVLLAGCAPEDLQSLLPTIQSGAIGRDVFLFEDNAVVADVVEGDLFAWGDSVRIESAVEGSAFIYGSQVQIDGTVDGSVTVVGREVVLGPTARVGQGVLFAGVLLQMEEGAAVGGGVTAVGYQVLLDGSIGEYVRGAMLRLRLDGTVGENPGGARLGSGGWAARPGGSLLAMAGLPLRALSDNAARLTGGSADGGEDRWVKLALEKARELVTLLVFGLLALALRPTLLYVFADRVGAAPLASAGYGVFTLVVGYAGSGLLAVVVGFLGYWLFSFSLDGLAIALVAGGGAALALWLILLTLFAAYGTKLVLAAWAGRWILRRVAPGAAENRYWPLVLGILLYLSITAIPYVGGVVSMVAGLLGLGAAWLVWRDLRVSV